MASTLLLVIVPPAAFPQDISEASPPPFCTVCPSRSGRLPWGAGGAARAGGTAWPPAGAYGHGGGAKEVFSAGSSCSSAGSSRLNQSPRPQRRRLPITQAAQGQPPSGGQRWPCARRPPRGAGELGETSVGDTGATGWVGASGGKGRSRAAVPPEPPQPRWLPGLRPGRALRRGPVACRLPTGLARRGCGRLRARPGKACARWAAWGVRADPRRGYQRVQGGRGWADAGGWDCVKSGFIFPILILNSPRDDGSMMSDSSLRD